MGNVSIVIGSWGSYNECNNRALGSKWLDLDLFSDWEDIEQELTKQGFELEGIDEELFIQDIEGLPNGCTNWDNMSPEKLFEILTDSGVLDNKYKFDIMYAYLEVRNFDDFEELVEQHGEDWDRDIILYKGFDYDDYGREMFETSGYNLPDHLEDFFDFEGYGKYLATDYVHECSDGLIEIF